jgi:hypothetical protein
MLAVAMGIFSQFSGNAIIAYYIHFDLDQVDYTSQRTQNIINNSILSFFTEIAMVLPVVKIGHRALFSFAPDDLSRCIGNDYRSVRRLLSLLIYLLFFFYRLE